MKTPLQITFHGIDGSDAVCELLHKRARKLDRYSRRILGCRIALERPNHRHQHGDVFRVRVTVLLPEKKLLIDYQAEDLYEGATHAFDTADRQIVECEARRTQKLSA